MVSSRILNRLGFGFFYCYFSASVEDYLSGALFSALATACAFGIINARQIVNNLDSIAFTSLFAKLASNTSNVASLSHVCALLG